MHEVVIDQVRRVRQDVEKRRREYGNTDESGGQALRSAAGRPAA
jgi:hypothetical protein